MGDWLENNVDWAFSRTRYWGTPLPFWICESCGAERCVESAEELGLPPDADLHRPYIDEVTLTCGCGGTMRRVPEVLDTWFDSGSMPFAQRGYPRAGREEFEATFPADFICEAIDQTRGWFYTLLAISTLIFGRNAYRNVICLGLILDEQGRKASKSRGNVLDPWRVFDTHGSDAMRWLFFTTQVGESYKLGPKTLQEVVRRHLLTLWNVYSFFVTYANIDGFEPGARPRIPIEERPVLDRWLLSRLGRLVSEVDSGLERYDVNAAARPVEPFIDELSNWYVRRSRRRFWKSESDQDKLAAYQTLHETLVTLSKLLAPFMPFLAEAMYGNLAGGGSVHLVDFPVSEPRALDPGLEAQMESARRAVEIGLAARESARLKVRQPLRSASLPGEPLPDEIAAIVREELNVKGLRFGAPEVGLDTEITRELRLEGIARELVRRIQDLRKREGLNIEDRIRTYYQAGGQVREAMEEFGDYVSAETLSVEITRERPEALGGVELEIEGEPVWLGLRRQS